MAEPIKMTEGARAREERERLEQQARARDEFARRDALRDKVVQKFGLPVSEVGRVETSPFPGQRMITLRTSSDGTMERRNDDGIWETISPADASAILNGPEMTAARERIAALERKQQEAKQANAEIEGRVRFRVGSNYGSNYSDDLAKVPKRRKSEEPQWLDQEGAGDPKPGDLVPAIELRVAMVPYQGPTKEVMTAKMEDIRGIAVRGDTVDVNLTLERTSYEAIGVNLRARDDGWQEWPSTSRTVYVRTDDRPLFEAVFEVAQLDWNLALRQAMKDLYKIDLGFSNEAQPKSLKLMKGAIDKIAGEIKEKFNRPKRRFAKREAEEKE